MYIQIDENIADNLSCEVVEALETEKLIMCDTITEQAELLYYLRKAGFEMSDYALKLVRWYKNGCNQDEAPYRRYKYPYLTNSCHVTNRDDIDRKVIPYSRIRQSLTEDNCHEDTFSIEDLEHLLLR